MITFTEYSLLHRIKEGLADEMDKQKVRPCDLAVRMGVKPQEVTRIMKMSHNTKLETLEAAFRALGKTLDFGVVAPTPMPDPPEAVHQLPIHLSKGNCSTLILRRASRDWRQIIGWPERHTPTHYVTADADAGFEDLPGFVPVEIFPEGMKWALSLIGIRGRMENCYVCVADFLTPMPSVEATP